MPASVEVPAMRIVKRFLRNTDGLTYVRFVVSPSGSPVREVEQPEPKYGLPRVARMPVKAKTVLPWGSLVTARISGSGATAGYSWLPVGAPRLQLSVSLVALAVNVPRTL